MKNNILLEELPKDFNLKKFSGLIMGNEYYEVMAK